jgi:hypothetical protein
MAETLDDALTMLESHDPTSDICPGLSAPAPALADRTISPAVLSLQAAALQTVCDDVTRRYRIAVGAFLAGIALRDPSFRASS